MDSLGNSLIHFAIFISQCAFYRRYHVAKHIFGRVMQQCRQPPFRGRLRHDLAKRLLYQKGMLGNRIWPVAACLAVPARDEGQPVGNIPDFDIDGSRVEKIKPAA